MSFLRSSLLAAVLVSAPALAVLVPSDARASVSIAVAFDALVKDADSVGVVTPVETKSLWEDGRIYTYTRVKIDQSVAGELGTGAEGWVRTMGGVVGKIGQLVDGEPVLTPGKSSLLFMRKFKVGGTWEVSARAQGQYPVVTDDTSKSRKIVRSASVGVLFPPKATAPVATDPANTITPQSIDPSLKVTEVAKVRLANEVLHDRALDDVTREIAASWRRLHPVTTPDAKK